MWIVSEDRSVCVDCSQQRNKTRLVNTVGRYSSGASLLLADDKENEKKLMDWLFRSVRICHTSETTRTERQINLNKLNDDVDGGA